MDRRWLYRLQQHLAITRAEQAALLVLLGLFAAGLVVRTVRERPRPMPTEVYAEVDSLFEAANAEFLAVGPPDSGVEARVQATAAPAGEDVPGALRVDLNTASAADLERLPRIGPKTAARILAYREANGPFRDVAELTRVRGIGEKTLAQLRPYLYAGARAGTAP